MVRTSCVFVAIAALSTIGCGPSAPVDDGPRVFSELPLLSVNTEGGAAIAVRTWPEQPPSRGSNDIQLVLVDGQGQPLEGLSLMMTPWMAAMGHGSSPQAAVPGDVKGTYVVSNVSLFMPGRWELRTSIEGVTSDRATIEFDVP